MWFVAWRRAVRVHVFLWRCDVASCKAVDTIHHLLLSAQPAKVLVSFVR